MFMLPAFKADITKGMILQGPRNFNKCVCNVIPETITIYSIVFITILRTLRKKTWS